MSWRTYLCDNEVPLLNFSYQYLLTFRENNDENHRNFTETNFLQKLKDKRAFKAEDVV